MVAHADGQCDGDRCQGEMVDMARELEAGTIDLIVGGHAHNPGFGVVNGIPIMRAGSDGRAVGVVDLVRGADGSRSFEARVDTAFVDRIDPDRSLASALAPHFARADAVAGRVVATLKDSLASSDRRLGWLIADAMRAFAGADVALQNTGGVRSDLPAGPVTYGVLYRVLPFENELWRLTLTGGELRQVIEHGLSGGAPPLLSGVEATYDPARVSGSRIVSLTLANGEPVRDGTSYTLVTADFLAEGGAGYTVLMRIRPERLGIAQHEAVMRYLETLPQPLEAPRAERAVAIGRR